MSLWLAVARAPASDDALLSGLTGALETHRRLVHALAAIDAERLAAVRATIATLEQELCDAARVLARLREVKEALAAASDTRSADDSG